MEQWDVMVQLLPESKKDLGWLLEHLKTPITPVGAAPAVSHHYHSDASDDALAFVRLERGEVMEAWQYQHIDLLQLHIFIKEAIAALLALTVFILMAPAGSHIHLSIDNKATVACYRKQHSSNLVADVILRACFNSLVPPTHWATYDYVNTKFNVADKYTRGTTVDSQQQLPQHIRAILDEFIAKLGMSRAEEKEGGASKGQEHDQLAHFLFRITEACDFLSSTISSFLAEKER
jgi:hypothetical protein